MTATVFFLLLILCAAAIAVKSYNTLQPLRLAVNKCKSNVDLTLKKKMTMLNQLIDVVKNYQQSEQFVQFKMAQDANATLLSGAYMQSGALFNSIQGMAERFPNLKASEQYTHYSHAIAKCEDDIQNARECYNEAVEKFNTERGRIPTVFIARFMGFNELNFHYADVSGMQEPNSLNVLRTEDGQRLQELLSGVNQGIGTANRATVGSTGQTGGVIGNGIAHPQPDGTGYNGNQTASHQ